MPKIPIRQPIYSQEYQSWFIPLTRGVIALVDADVMARLAKWNWHAALRKTMWIAQRNCQLPSGSWTTRSMHLEIMAPADGLQVDHRKHRDVADRLIDNRRGNLRVGTVSQNQMNQRPTVGTSSIYKGVGAHKATGRWQAKILVTGKRLHLGLFDDELVAARAYDAAATRHFGEFALTNKALGLIE
jgi:hypothetical protein